MTAKLILNQKICNTIHELIRISSLYEKKKKRWKEKFLMFIRSDTFEEGKPEHRFCMREEVHILKS